MVMVQLSLTEEIEMRARAAGLLDGDKIVALIAAELERQQIVVRDAAIVRARDILAKLDAITPSLTQNEIDAEIEAARGEKG
jgi:hypothetical protein